MAREIYIVEKLSPRYSACKRCPGVCRMRNELLNTIYMNSEKGLVPSGRAKLSIECREIPYSENRRVYGRASTGTSEVGFWISCPNSEDVICPRRRRVVMRGPLKTRY